MYADRVSRLLRLIGALRSGRRLDADGLAELLGVSRRTVFRDLKVLQSAGVPYRFHPDRRTYAISDSYFLPSVHLELEESLALLLVTRAFLSREVHPSYQQALRAALKLESSLPAAVRAECGPYLDDVTVHWPPASSAESTADLFQTLQRALARRERLAASYDSVHEEKEIRVLIDPWRLVFIARGWYLLAWSHHHGEVRTFKIDRFTSTEPTGDRFDPPPADFTEKSHWGAAWRMIPEGKLYDIKLRFSPTVAQNVEEVQWHPSQETTQLENGHLHFEVRVDGLSEITWWILGYGDHVEVVEPPELRRRIGQIAERMVLRATDNGTGDGETNAGADTTRPKR